MSLVPSRYEFTSEDLALLDQIHALITSHPDRFREAGAALDRRFSVEEMVAQAGPPISEEQRQAMLQAALEGKDPEPRELAKLATALGNEDAAREMLIRINVLAVALPSREEWQSLGRRFSAVRQDLFSVWLPVETPSPSWEWSAHVLLVCWLITEPRAEEVQPLLTEFQRWKWDSWEPEDEVYPGEIVPGELGRSVAAFGVNRWPTLLNGARRAMRCARMLGLLNELSGASVASSDELGERPLLSPKAAAASDLLVDQPSDRPLTSLRICELLARDGVALDDSVFRRDLAPKLRALGLQADRRLGYWYPAGALARRLKSQQPPWDTGSPPRSN